MFRKHAVFTNILALVLVLLFASSALAEGLTSQFGFTGWPNLPSTSCTTGATQNPSNTTQWSSAGKNSVGNATSSANATTKQPTAPTNPSTDATAAGKSPARQPSSTVGDYTTQSSSAQEQMMLNLLNQDRNRYGRQPLTLDPTLSSIARIKSCDMRDNHYFSHQSPTYGRVKDMLKTFGYSFNGAGENIAHHATVEKAQAAFLSSSAHRQNILSTAWTKVGIGICTDANGFVYVTQIFVR